MLLSLSLVLLQFLQSQPKRSVLMLQSTLNRETVAALSATANMAGVKSQVSVQTPVHPLGQALPSLLLYR